MVREGFFFFCSGHRRIFFSKTGSPTKEAASPCNKVKEHIYIQNWQTFIKTAASLSAFSLYKSKVLARNFAKTETFVNTAWRGQICFLITSSVLVVVALATVVTLVTANTSSSCCLHAPATRGRTCAPLAPWRPNRTRFC